MSSHPIGNALTEQQLVCLTDHELKAIIRSTAPMGRFGYAIPIAREELARRRAA